MRAVVQRVKSASVRVEGKTVSTIPDGLLVLLGLKKGDTEETLVRLAKRLPRYRFFEDPQGKMNLSLSDVGGSVLVVSQFTLVANLDKGLRPSFDAAMEPDEAKRLVSLFARTLREDGVEVGEGVFGAHMDVELVNNGPVTFVLGEVE